MAGTVLQNPQQEQKTAGRAPRTLQQKQLQVQQVQRPLAEQITELRAELTAEGCSGRRVGVGSPEPPDGLT